MILSLSPNCSNFLKYREFYVRLANRPAIATIQKCLYMAHIDIFLKKYADRNLDALLHHGCLFKFFLRSYYRHRRTYRPTGAYAL